MNPDRSGRPGRPAVPPRGGPADRLRPGSDHGRPAPPRREQIRPGDRVPAGSRPPTARPAGPRPAETRSAAGHTTTVPASGGRRTRGLVAVLGVFLVTLAGAGIDSFVGVGLGIITLVALVGSTAMATLVVRRSDLVSMVVAPPLVFIAVAALNIGMAPSATFSLPTVATLLIRGFPTMAMATGAALVLAIGRLIARR